MSNTFGKIFKVTTFGESHKQHIGVVIDGCPPNIEITEEEIDFELKKRRPGFNKYISQRKEEDRAKIVSGVFDKRTTGAPICIMIENKDVKSCYYDEIKDLLRPSHANYPYLQKYGIFDHRGAGRASGRETVARVAAAVIANKILRAQGIEIYAYLKKIADIEARIDFDNLEKAYQSMIFCPDALIEKEMIKKLKEIKDKKDSIGGVVEFYIKNVDAGLGDPIFDKLNARIAYGLMSIPGAKGFEMGDGFASVSKKGSVRNDAYTFENDKIKITSNNEGGVLAGISTGQPIIGRLAFKPPSSVNQKIGTVDIYGSKKTLNFEEGSRFDVCIAIRAVPVVKAMLGLVLVDSFLMNKIMKFKDEKDRCST